MRKKSWIEFSLLTSDSALKKFWKFYRNMKNQRRNDIVYSIRDETESNWNTDEDKGQALLTRCLQQAD